MNKIFTLHSPLYIKYPNGETRVVEEIFAHPKGILYFELFWEKDPTYSIHLIEGEISGDGPWRVGKCSFHVLGCNHTHPQMCETHSFWQSELLQNPAQFRSDEVVKIALQKGAVLPLPVKRALNRVKGVQKKVPDDCPINDERYD